MNEQKPMPHEQNPQGVLRVHSMFKTIQGEGPFAGHAALFIRLYGCNLQCPWCDTDYTSQQNLTSPEELLELVLNEHDWGQTDENNFPLIVITGGEPFRQNIGPLLKLLLSECYRVQIETNGTLYPGDFPIFPWSNERLTVVCSPKTGKIHPRLAPLIHAYKYVMERGGVGDGGYPRTALGHTTGGFNGVAQPPKGWAGPVYLQPMDAKDPISNEANIQQVVEVCMQYPGKFIMGVQMHKLTGLP